MTWREQKRELLTRAFIAGVEAAQPATMIHPDLINALFHDIDHDQPKVVVLGAGKAAASMAAALENAWSRAGLSPPLTGVVVTRDGYVCDTRLVEVVTAGHPNPDERSQAHSIRMLEIAASLGKNDTLIGLWSGGGSSLLAAPPEGVGMESLGSLTNRLILSGATIGDLNVVRRHLSIIAGGRLAKCAAPASVVNIIIPDVVAEGSAERQLADVASGPCVPDPSTRKEAIDVLDRLGIHSVPDIRRALLSENSETPSTHEEIGTADIATMVLSEKTAIARAKAELRKKGFKIIQLPPMLTGEARTVANQMADTARRHAVHNAPAAILTGGELTVTVTGDGKGGPNQEYALALALALDGAKNICAFAGDTDGIDGIGEAAGAFVFPDTLERMRAAGIDPEAALANNDAGAAFEAIGDLLITGPTFTNLNDLRLIVIGG